jgi:hypothetical protein
VHLIGHKTTLIDSVVENDERAGSSHTRRRDESVMKLVDFEMEMILGKVIGVSVAVGYPICWCRETSDPLSLLPGILSQQCVGWQLR